MKSALISTNSLHPFAPFGAHISSKPKNPNVFCIKPITLPAILSSKSQSKPSRLVALCASHNASPSNAELKDRGVEEAPSEDFVEDENSQSRWNVEVRSPSVPPNVVPAAKLSLSDQAFFLLAFIACTAMGRAATSLSKLADTAREELPSTMAAIRLSGMEISDLTLELSDLR
ncbi:hypothetical protein FH972_027167 [Carpinus fangiana]|uniref:Uncharacterized protein n=1 Tax=Carpinus fangiana TaxID=176857 RepID=A0A5N6L8M4_9ROSI|nr:hypothetical protein FH972_027167 [Carpinus fangiana]